MENLIAEITAKSIKSLYNADIGHSDIQIEKTNPDYEGDFTVVVFPLTRYSKKSPADTASAIGEYLQQKIEDIYDFNIIKGFLNITLYDSYWIRFFLENLETEYFGYKNQSEERPYVIEFSSPNTNKPLHLGHVRNNLLGWSISEILKANGKDVVRINLINDRGIHICKSMLAWQKWGDGESPESSGLKGDHLIGKHYVLFDKEHKKQIEDLVHR
ncbi:MAG: arginine--tRNA ligase, partial [Bacteroidales bacterium]|nr:arginine--tRNA ligase [Bacteroidales bacterium]